MNINRFLFFKDNNYILMPNKSVFFLIYLYFIGLCLKYEWIEIDFQ